MELSSNAIGSLTITSFVAWCALYGLCCYLRPQRSYEWNCRIVVVTHALIVIVMSSTFGFLYNPWPFTHPGGKSNIYEVCTMIVCLGFFLFDFCWCGWFYDEDTRIMIVHHLVSIIGLCASLAIGYSGTDIGMCIFLGELTNPMLQLRWFMRQSGIREGIVYEVNDLVFMVTFAVCRVGIGSCFLYCHALHPLPMFPFKIGGVAIYIVSMVLMVNIFIFAFHKYTRMYRRWKSGDTTIDGIDNKIK